MWRTREMHETNQRANREAPYALSFPLLAISHPAPCHASCCSVQRLMSSRWPNRLRFFDSLAEACDTASQPSEGGGDATTVVVLGGTHDAGKGGVRLTAKGISLVGVKGKDEYVARGRDGGGVSSHFVHSRSCMTLDPRISHPHNKCRDGARGSGNWAIISVFSS